MGIADVVLCWALGAHVVGDVGVVGVVGVVGDKVLVAWFWQAL
jgi:hypothetical protein